MIGKSILIPMESNFFDLGGNSLNSIFTIAKIRDRGYYIEISDFISACNLSEVLDKMRNVESESISVGVVGDQSLFVAEALKMEHKEEAIQ